MKKTWLIILLIGLLPISCTQDELLQSDFRENSGKVNDESFWVEEPKVVVKPITGLPVTSRSNACNDPLFKSQWGLSNINGIDVSALKAWKWSTGVGVKVALIDMGVDKTHPDLSANISSLSYDAMTGTSPSKIYGAHGTYCAGVIAAVKNNGIGIVGIAPDAKIMSVSLNLGTPMSPDKIVNAINWAWQNGADVINMSLSCGDNKDIRNAINNALTKGRNGKGCIVVAASGNDSRSNVSFPASIDNVIAVGSIDETGRRALTSNYGSGLDLVAPGNKIATTDYSTGGYTYAYGTSLAAPMVSGIAALLISQYPDMSRSEIQNKILESCKKLPLNTYNEVKRGLVNAYHALMVSKFSDYKLNLKYHFVDKYSLSYSVPSPFNMKWTVTSNYVDPSLGDDDSTVTSVVKTYEGKQVIMPNIKIGAGVFYEVEGSIVDEDGEVLKTSSDILTSGPPCPITGNLLWNAEAYSDDYRFNWEEPKSFILDHRQYYMGYTFEPYCYYGFDEHFYIEDPNYSLEVTDNTADILDIDASDQSFIISFLRGWENETNTSVKITTSEGVGRPFYIRIPVD